MISFKQYQKRIEMKWIEATVQAIKITAMTETLNYIVKGFTIMEGKGRGSGIRQEIRSCRGTGTITADITKLQLLLQL